MTHLIETNKSLTHITRSTIVILAFLGTSAMAKEDVDSQLQEERLLAAMPEFAQDKDQTLKFSSNPKMKCFVDTPAWDNYRYGFCLSIGWAFTTTALFKIDNVPSDFTILWSDSRCSSTRTSCTLPISQYQSIVLNATVLNNANNTFSNTTATASYEGMF
ncbi:MAG: hypothetical protein L3J52_03680 [Proteobacteria bacterium]|nr:hypothetical protein [Pseudomonadota bacterium]